MCTLSINNLNYQKFSHGAASYTPKWRNVHDRILDTSVCNIESQLYISYLQESKGHDGAKPSMCVYLNNGKIFTTGFSRMSERQYALWDEVKLFEIF